MRREEDGDHELISCFRKLPAKSGSFFISRNAVYCPSRFKFEFKTHPAMSGIASTPAPPYYAVIFTTLRTEGDNGYAEMANRMEDLAKTQPGFLGIESARNETGITVSYWKDEASIRNWKMNSEHLFAQKMGREKWYASFMLRVAKVERSYGI